MSTRGVFGMLKGGVEKITYNQSDSYPDWLGKKMFSFINETSDPDMEKMFIRIKMVSEDGKPSKAQIAHCKKMDCCDFDVSDGCVEDWYCLLRLAQGSFDFYKKGLRYMSKEDGFFDDRLFCEWGWIINLDNRSLDIYHNGRQLLASISFDILRKMTEKKFVDKIEKLVR